MSLFHRRTLHALATLPFKETDGVGTFLSPKALQLITSIQRDNIDLLNKTVQGTPLEHLSVYELLERVHRDSSKSDLYSIASQIWNTDFFLQSLSPHPTQMTPRLVQVIESQYGSLDRFKQIFLSYGKSLIGSGWIWWGRAYHYGAPDDSTKFSVTFNTGSPIYENVYPSVFSNISKTPYAKLSPSGGPAKNSLFSNFSFPDFLDATTAKKEIATLTNQIPPPSSTIAKIDPIDARLPKDANGLPVFGVSVWEHAYLLDYGNDRSTYIDRYWDHINWNRVASMLNLY